MLAGKGIGIYYPVSFLVVNAPSEGGQSFFTMSAMF